jgi:hypothetical protein
MIAISRPERLFKYRTAAQAKEILLKGVLWFASPLTFNDPFDCMLSPSFNGSTKELKEQFMAMLRSKNPLANRATRRRELKRLNPIIDNSLFEEAFEGAFNTWRSRTGILCFGEDQGQILMWSHYAEGHQGVCLGFKTDNEFFNGVREVKYASRFPDLSFFPKAARALAQEQSSADLLRFFDDLLLTKALEWKYEGEWRLIRQEINGNGVHSFPLSLLDSVVFGCRMAHENEHDLLNVIKTLPSHPRVFRTVRKKGEFGLDFRQL